MCILDLESKKALVSYELVYIFINHFSYSNKLMMPQVNYWNWYCSEMNVVVYCTLFICFTLPPSGSKINYMRRILSTAKD